MEGEVTMRMWGRLFALCAGIAGLTTNAQAQKPDQVYFEFQVTKPVRPLPNMKGPVYPRDLRAAGVTGEVLAQFIVDTLGQPVMTSYKVLRSSHELFTNAVHDAVEKTTYQPAELNGKKVRQLVQQPFAFAIAGKDSASAKQTPSGIVAPTDIPPGFPRPPYALTPAPSAGKVEGWWMETRVSMDSANATPPFVSTMRIYGAAGRLRMQAHSSSQSQMGEMVLIADSAAHRMLAINTTRRTATATPARLPNVPTIKHAAYLVSRSVTELGDGGVLAGVPTHHYRVVGTMGSRMTYGERSCTTERPFETEAWTSDDPTAREIEQLMTASVRTMPMASAQVTSVRDSVLKLPGARMRTVGRMPYLGKDGKPITATVTFEVTEFGKGPLDAALFEPPEGYQFIDASRFNPPAALDSLMRATMARTFAKLADSTALAPGETRTCTPARP